MPCICPLDVQRGLVCNSVDFPVPPHFTNLYYLAFWTNGPNWPAGGEIDIIEGVNNYTNNQATIHTNPGCSLPSTSSATLNMSGTLVASTDCSASDTGNQGCGVRSNLSNSFGSGFNANGGGVYASAF
jgi:hypothetical protein